MAYIEVELPDGNIAEFPDTMSDSEISSVLQKQYQPQEQGLTSQDISDLARTGLRGLTFGQLANVQGLFSPELEARERARMERVSEKYPLASIATEIAPAIATGGAALKGAARVAPNIMKGVQNFATKGFIPKSIVASGTGALSGGIYGSGVSEEAGKGGATGALYGSLLGPAGLVAGKGVAALGNRAQGLTSRAMRAVRGIPAPMAGGTVGEIAEQAAVPAMASGPLPVEGVGKVTAAIKRDFPDNWQQVMQRYAQEGDAALVDLYGAKSRQLAKGAAQYAGGQQQAERFFGERVLKAPEKIKESIAKNVTSNEAYLATVEDILEAGRKKAAPLYQQSASQRVKVTMKPEIEDALQRARRNFPSELANVADDSVQALDYAKRVLDDDIAKAMRAGESNLARSRTQIKNELLQEMDFASPAYKEARKASGDYLGLTRAMDEGKNFMKMDAEMLGKTFKSMSEQEKIAFRSGVGKQLRDLIDKTPEGQNFYNRLFGRPEQQKKLATVLSPEQFKNLASDMKAQDRLFKLRNEVLGGSPTASKGVAAAEVAGIAGDIATASTTGAPVGMVIGGTVRRLFDGLSDEAAEQVSKILYETRPEEKLKLYYNMTGGKGLDKAQKQLAKKAYFEAQSLFDSPEIKGALAAGIIAEKE